MTKPKRPAPRNAPRPLPTRTYALVLTGDLADHHVTMGSPSGADIIAARTGSMRETAAVQMLASRVVAHDFDVADLAELPYWALVEILTNWMQAMAAEARQ